MSRYDLAAPGRPSGIPGRCACRAWKSIRRTLAAAVLASLHRSWKGCVCCGFDHDEVGRGTFDGLRYVEQPHRVVTHTALLKMRDHSFEPKRA